MYQSADTDYSDKGDYPHREYGAVCALADTACENIVVQSKSTLDVAA